MVRELVDDLARVPRLTL